GRDMLETAFAQAVESGDARLAATLASELDACHVSACGMLGSVNDSHERNVRKLQAICDQKLLDEYDASSRLASGLACGVFRAEVDHNPSERPLRTFDRFLRFFNAVLFDVQDQHVLCGHVDEIAADFAGHWVNDPEPLRREAAEKAAGNIRTIKGLCSLQPSGEQMCKFHLASAELARFQGDLHEAIAHFEESVERAHTHKMPLLEAWATERQAVFWYGQHSKRLARPIFEAASQQWVALGSQGKATQLQKLYADAFPKALGPGKKLKVGLASFSSFLKIPNQEEREDGAPLAENLRSPRVLDDFVSPMSARVVSQSGVFFGRGRQPDLDVTTILKVAETLSKEENLDVLLDQMLMHLTSNTGATKAYFLLLEDGALSISARYEISDLGQVHRDVGSASGVPSSDVLPMMIINYVCRIPEAVVLADACEDPSYRRDPYVEKN
ncbi:Chk1 protein kinase, partial [Polyrhizophydium stewartii]